MRGITRNRVALLAVALVALGCTKDVPSALGKIAARLLVLASIATDGGELVLHASYVREAGGTVLITSRQVEVQTSGQLNVPLPLELTACLADDGRVGGATAGCPVIVDVVLYERGGSVLDSVRIGPLDVREGASATTSASVRSVPEFMLRAPGSVVQVEVGDAANVEISALNVRGTMPSAATLIVSGLPDGMVAHFDPPTVSPSGTARMQLAVGPSFGVGSYPIVVRGTVAGLDPAELSLSVAVSGTERIKITAPAADIAVGESMQLTATLTGKSGRELRGRTVTWSAEPAARATVSADGEVTGVAGGDVTVTATSDGVTDSLPLAVLAAPTRVRIAYTASLLALGSSTRLSAVALDSSGNALSGRTVTWRSSNPARGTVEANGLYTAISHGGVEVTATIQGVEETLTMCNAAPYAFGTVISSSSTTNGCERETVFTYTVASQQFFEAIVTAGADAELSPVITSSFWKGRSRWFWGLRGNVRESRPTLVGPGTYAVGVDDGGTQFTLETLSRSPTCSNIVASYNVRVTIPVSAGCPILHPSPLPSGDYYGVAFYLPLIEVGEALTVSASASAGSPLIEFSDGSAITASSAPLGGMQQTVTEVASRVGTRIVFVSTRTPGVTTGTLDVEIVGPPSRRTLNTRLMTTDAVADMQRARINLGVARAVPHAKW